jgi:hypothetical protein
MQSKTQPTPTGCGGFKKNEETLIPKKKIGIFN